MIEIGKNKNIEAIEIVKYLNSTSINLYDNFYSGDKDTFVEAFNSISELYKFGEFYDLSTDDRSKYSELYKSEIDIEFDRLVLYGKEIISFHKKVDTYLNDLIDQEVSNFNVEEKREYNLKKLL
jgi:hypothetical protein